MAPPEASPVGLVPVGGPHGNKPLDALLEPVTPKTLFNGASAPPADNGVAELIERTSALRINGLPAGKAKGGQDAGKPVSGTSSAPSGSDQASNKDQAADEDVGYLSDDPDECQDPVALNEIAAQAGVAITLLVPFAWQKEIPRVINTVNHLLVLWGRHMSEGVKATTRCQRLSPTFLSKQHFGRIEVVFLMEADACFMRSREIEHYTADNKKLILGWQHPENKEYLRERAAHPEAIEVLLKGVPAVISPSMIKKNLVSALLLKRGRTAFREGLAFHRVLDPVSGSDTDKIKGLVFQHQGDKRLHQRASMLSSVRPFPRAAASMKLSPALKILLADPAIALVSSGGAREEWVCAQEDCEKAHGSSFEKAVEHVQSIRHVEGGEEPFRLVAAYLPAQACNRAKFHKVHLEPFVLAQPQSKHMVLVGDLNMIADPDLDKSSGVGSGRENQRFLEAWRTHDLRDAFRVLHPTEREYTFKDRASQSKTRINRAMVSMSLLGNLEGVRHVAVPRNLTDHWGKRRGVRKVIQEAVEGLSKAGKVSLEQVLPKLTAVLRAHEKEERKRVLATQRHLTEEVERLRHMIMGGPTDDKTKALLLSREEQQEAYRENERERLEVFAGLAAELQGEIPSPHLSAQVKMRKDRTLIEEVQFKGSRRRGSQAVLSAASEYFAEAFKAEAAGSQPSGLIIQVDRKLPGVAADRLKAPWTELESPFADLPAPSSSWEVERELLCFNRHIMYRGGSPFGNQKGTSGILKTRMGDLLITKEDGSRDIKDVKTLAREFGSVVPARWAKKAFEAAPTEWKALLRAPRTAEAVVAAAKVVRTVLARTQEFLYWTVKEAKDGEVVLEDIRCSDGLNLVVPSTPVVAAFSAKRTEPVAIKGGTVLGAMGEPRAKLCQTLLVGDNMRPAAPRVMNERQSQG
ncbi:unnamed protein product [Closterium sp. NIES-64]|nr:unnamed protein product [Closterium sp. NIES-64]